jgi:thiamine-phosphate pyrophosphorylase
MAKNSTRPPIDVALYVIVDAEHARVALDELARLVVDGGATMVQLRAKTLHTRDFVAQARAVKAALAGTNVPLIVNDRVDVALAVGADGVHVGHDDMTPHDARRLVGRHAIVGLSVKTLAQAAAAPVERIDYVGIGGVFATSSKDNPEPPIGLAGLRDIAVALRTRAPALPLAAIAGINGANAAAVVAAGVDGIAVISAVSLAADPRAAARELRRIVDAARQKKGAA